MASSDDLTEKEVKDFIKGILTSTPQVSTLQSLQRDYRELIGQNIPFYKFKYNSLEHFLKSNPDVCTVNGSGLFAQVYPVIDEKIAHINKLVTHQRISTKGRRKPSNPRRFSAPVQTRNFSTPRFSFDYSISPYNSSSSANSGSSVYNPVPSNKETQIKVSQNVSQTFLRKNVNINNASSPSEALIKREQNKIGSQLVKQKLDYLLENKLRGGGIDARADLSKSSIEKWNNLNINNNNNQIPEKLDKLQIIDNQEKVQLQPYKSGSHTVHHSHDEDISNVPRRVQSSLKTLIDLYEDGIWVSDLPTEYRKLFKKDLSFMDYGYTSLIEMCISLKHIFHYVRPGTDDFKLYDRSKPLPPSVEKNYTIASYDVSKKTTDDKTLPESDGSNSKGYIPEDIFHYGNVIPNQFLPEGTKADNVFDVVIVEIYDPSKFWFYLGTSDTPAVLDELMDELQDFYNKPENAKEYAISPGALKEGLYCVQVIFGEYHRARIVKVFPECSEYVRVLYIDYGTVTKAPVEGMCFLHSNFATLPAQAIRCRLANIVPPEKGHPWPRSTSDRFREMVNRRDTKIKVSYIDWNEEYVCAFLADFTDSKKISYINEMLVKEGHAVWDGEKQASPFVMSKFKCKVQKIHLFPTFTELEYGLVPSASEMYSLAEMLVPLHLCIPQYFELNDEQVLSEDENMEEMENAFIETVKNHRRFTTFDKIDVGTLITTPTIDFSIFGSMKDEMAMFCNRLGLTGPDQRKNEDCPSDEREFSDCDNKVGCIEGNQATATNIVDFEPARMFREDRELTESIIQKLENCFLLDSETSINPDCDNERDLLSPLVPQKSSPDYLDDYGKYLTVEEIVEHELATVLEQSESELDVPSPRIKLPNRTLNTEPTDINIFDNPEAFKNTFSSSLSSSSPVSPPSFWRTVETKLDNYKEIKETEDTTFLSRSSSTTGNQETENPFISKASWSLDPLKSYLPTIQAESDFNRISCSDSDQKTLDVGTSNNRSESSYLGNKASHFFRERVENQRDKRLQNKIRFPFKSNIEERQNAFVNSFSKTNPFREYLNAELELSTDDNLINLKCPIENDRVKTPTIKEVGVQTLEPKENSCQTESAKGILTGVFCTDSSIASTRLSDIIMEQKMSTKAAPFIPMNNSYTQWSNGGGFPVPHYPQWSDGNNYSAPYFTPYSLPNPRVRPPPGFMAPHQGIPQSSNQLSPYYTMERTGPPIFSQYRGPPGYFGPPRQMAPPPPEFTSSFGAQNNDFYERFNEVLINKNKGQS